MGVEIKKALIRKAFLLEQTADTSVSELAKQTGMLKMPKPFAPDTSTALGMTKGGLNLLYLCVLNFRMKRFFS